VIPVPGYHSIQWIGCLLFPFSTAKEHFLPKKLFIHAVISIYINITCGEKDDETPAEAETGNMLVVGSVRRVDMSMMKKRYVHIAHRGRYALLPGEVV